MNIAASPSYYYSVNKMMKVRKKERLPQFFETVSLFPRSTGITFSFFSFSAFPAP
jgi:hypothetical protein